MSSSAGPSRVSRPRRSSAFTSNGKTVSSTGTADGARTGASRAIFVSGDWETMALYLGSEVTKRKGLFPRGWPGKRVKRVFARISRSFTSLPFYCVQYVDARDKPGHDEHLH